MITNVPYPQQNRLTVLKEEVELLKEQIRPHDTGHIHTTISVLTERLEEIQKELDKHKVEEPIIEEVIDGG